MVHLLPFSSLCLNRLLIHYYYSTSPNAKPKKPSNPIQLFPQSKTQETLKQIHAQRITTGLILQTYPLSRILHPSHHLILHPNHFQPSPQPPPYIFFLKTLISSLIIHKLHTHIAFSLYTRILLTLH